MCDLGIAGLRAPPGRWLGDPAEPAARLLAAAAGLGAKLGAVLLQLPPTLRADPGTLDACLSAFQTIPAGRRSSTRSSSPSWRARPGGA